MRVYLYTVMVFAGFMLWGMFSFIGGLLGA